MCSLWTWLKVPRLKTYDCVCRKRQKTHVTGVEKYMYVYLAVFLKILALGLLQIHVARYLPTWREDAIDAKLDMNPSPIVGMSLFQSRRWIFPDARSGPGAFQLGIGGIKAMRTQSCTRSK